MPSIADIASALESWAPRGLAQSYDNVGLQVGRPSRQVTRVLVALDCTSAVVEEARSTGAELVVVHHPLLFRPLKSLTDRALVPSIALDLAEAGIGLYAIHTNLDAARGGVSFALAGQLGLTGVRFLQPLEERPLRKLVVYVPESHADTVRQAMASAGAGSIGEYDECAFEMGGTGYFRPRDTANPHIGSAGGGVERVSEVRVETEVLVFDVDRVLTAVRAVHPYDEMAYDVVVVEQPYRDAGIGAVGELTEPMSLQEFLSVVCTALGTPAVRHTGGLDRPVRRVAVCGGSGSEFLNAAIASGADAFVTADITYHRWFDALDTRGHPRIAVIDAGHYETEAITGPLLVDWLSQRFPDIAFTTTGTHTSPVHTFVQR